MRCTKNLRSLCIIRRRKSCCCYLLFALPACHGPSENLLQLLFVESRVESWISSSWGWKMFVLSLFKLLTISQKDCLDSNYIIVCWISPLCSLHCWLPVLQSARAVGSQQWDSIVMLIPQLLFYALSRRHIAFVSLQISLPGSSQTLGCCQHVKWIKYIIKVSAPVGPHSTVPGVVPPPRSVPRSMRTVTGQSSLTSVLVPCPVPLHSPSGARCLVLV